MKRIASFIVAALLLFSCEQLNNDLTPVNRFSFTAVDLGLSVKWANANLGAKSVEESGGYYSWGETEEKETYIWGTYKWCMGDNRSLLKYNTKYYCSYYFRENGVETVDNITVLELEDDAAHILLGGGWRMPSEAEWSELKDNCTWKWATVNGVNGYKLTSNINGASIFLPAAGYRFDGDYYFVGEDGDYWSSSLNEDSPSGAWRVLFSPEEIEKISGTRMIGRTIRPVSN